MYLNLKIMRKYIVQINGSECSITDVEDEIVILWQHKQFNRTQKVISTATSLSPQALAKSCRLMGEYLQSHNPELL